jgi:hypothetical protein
MWSVRRDIAQYFCVPLCANNALHNAVLCKERRFADLVFGDLVAAQVTKKFPVV